MKYNIVDNVVLIIIAIVVVIVINYHGIGITPDSIYYAEAAKNIASGSGYQAFDFVSGSNLALAHFPPGLPLLLALGLRSGLTIETTGIIINSLSFAILVITLYNMSLLISTKRVVALIICLMLFHPSLLSQYTSLVSEPPFIALITPAIFTLWLYQEKQNLALLLVSAVLLGVSVIVRYAGLPFIVIGGGLLLINRRNLREIIIFGGIALVPILMWLIYITYFNPQSATIRTFAIHIVTLGTLLSGARTIGGWFVPVVIRFRTGFGSLIALMALVAYYNFFRQNILTKLSKFIIFISSFQIAYGIFILVSISFFDAHTPLDARILSPIYSLTVMGIIIIFSTLTLNKKQYALVICYLLFISTYSWSWIWLERLDANNFSASAWTQSSQLAQVQQLPANAIIYSNAADAIYWYTGRIVRPIPNITEAGTSRINAKFEQEIATMRTALDNGAYLVYFEQVTWRDYLPTLDDLQPLPVSQVITD